MERPVSALPVCTLCRTRGLGSNARCQMWERTGLLGLAPAIKRRGCGGTNLAKIFAGRAFGRTASRVGRTKPAPSGAPGRRRLTRCHLYTCARYAVLCRPHAQATSKARSTCELRKPNEQGRNGPKPNKTKHLQHNRPRLHTARYQTHARIVGVFGPFAPTWRQIPSIAKVDRPGAGAGPGAAPKFSVWLVRILSFRGGCASKNWILSIHNPFSSFVGLCLSLVYIYI